MAAEEELKLSQGKIIPIDDFNTLKNRLENELKRRSYNSTTKTNEILTNFSEYNSNLSAGKDMVITKDHFNNLIKALNKINAGTTNYDAVELYGIIHSIVELSSVLGQFENCDEYTTDEDKTKSGCSNGTCMGLCHGCAGECKGSASSAGGGDGCGDGCQNTCTSYCGDACSYSSEWGTPDA